MRRCKGRSESAFLTRSWMRQYVIAPPHAKQCYFLGRSSAAATTVVEADDNLWRRLKIDAARRGRTVANCTRGGGSARAAGQFRNGSRRCRRTTRVFSALCGSMVGRSAIAPRRSFVGAPQMVEPIPRCNREHRSRDIRGSSRAASRTSRWRPIYAAACCPTTCTWQKLQLKTTGLSVRPSSPLR